ncbi:molybdate ABC transporter substrate-binding protein [Vibrio sp. JC009]|uniref:molybdate ABC transporter substrate-binding protein n=1 Tax=Vibrio sp. JC009 TaxID=2912314 RepID=UPI0023B10221|nr:molybdate ABC transporter substrate-binding protein [Vibrio sp. JC009]WED24086.1 molybdate ABC transporter substrate-binding protein [Vibrio sp. JC009]
MKPFKLLIIILAAFSDFAYAGDVSVAVANNFYKPLQVLAKDFEKESGESVSISTGSTGQLYAQIVNGAPFDVFLAADKKRPGKLVDAGIAKEAFTYAKGRLVLWSPDSARVKQAATVLQQPKIKHIALPNPKLAPYGWAAVQVMKNTGVYQAAEPKLVSAKGLNAVFQFVSTGNAEVGFLAMSQIYRDGKFIDGSYWLIPDELYEPIKQDAVLMTSSFDKPTARAFIAYLKSDRAKKLITQFGYL